ncbi:hypothetical protein [Thiosulfatihalobacter marinus]|uniref:hypothetical protein n=1 Tax=Thiosulfatihalobacter marinus TaxID=2792481 RepID=UPI0018D6CAB4|nr:hypothetical protein [Thiosulfatihalobacter marinus]
MKHLIPLFLLAAPALADAPIIESASATRIADGWRFDVTLTHPDTGWDHYADGWRAETEGGSVLGTRELVHPHVDEQPFTRSLSPVALADGIATVLIRARCNIDGWSRDVFALELR